MSESNSVLANAGTDVPIAGGLGLSSLGAAITGIAINDAGVVSGTGQGNLGVTIPLAIAGFAGAFLARAYYRRSGVRRAVPFMSGQLKESPSYFFALGLVFALLVRSALPTPSMRSVVEITAGVVMIAVGVRAHLQYVRSSRMQVSAGA